MRDAVAMVSHYAHRVPERRQAPRSDTASTAVNRPLPPQIAVIDARPPQAARSPADFRLPDTAVLDPLPGQIAAATTPTLRSPVSKLSAHGNSAVEHELPTRDVCNQNQRSSDQNVDNSLFSRDFNESDRCLTNSLWDVAVSIS